ncbi:MAG: hypothetical protein EP343_29750 [Deltaproteobacteria bacterium]|nr:MAG: hypothetical protein EP343_29750 [Deltaproteobacteria bacterium]
MSWHRVIANWSVALLLLMQACSPPPCLTDQDCPGSRCDLQTSSCLVLGQECSSGDQRPCYEGDSATRGVGACRLGEQTCQVDGTWGVCKNQGTPRPETCDDTVDNNCDGQVNEGCASPTFCKALSLNQLLQLKATYVSMEPKQAEVVLQLVEQGALRWFARPSLSILPDPWVVQSIAWEQQASPATVTARLATSRWAEPLRLQVKGELVFPENNNLRCAISWTSEPFLLGCNDNLMVCSNQCIDVQTDPKHCGACEKSCATGDACCSGSCVSLSSSQDHCGTCGKACKEGQQCCGGACVTLSTDKQHCGACGVVCKQGEDCCGGACVNLQNSVQHCGVCGQSCVGGERCCGGSCVSLSDPKHCGACGKACSTLQGCVVGQCVFCRADVECAPGQRCRQGSCVTCPASQVGGAGTAPCDRGLSPSQSTSSLWSAMAFDSNGNAYIAGSFEGTLRLGSASLSASQRDLSVVQWTGLGAWGWAKVAGSAVDDSSPFLRVDAQDRLFLAGVFGPNVSLFREQASSSQTLLNGSSYSCLAQFSTQGVVRWAHCVGGGSSNVLGGLATTSDGAWSLAVSMEKATALYCNGQNLLPRDDPQSPYGSFLGIVVGTSGGVCEAGRSAGSELGKGSLTPTTLEVDAKGNTYVTGTFDGVISWGSSTLSSQGGQDVFVAQVTQDKKLGWIVSLGGSQRDDAKGLVLDKAGHLYVAGSFEGVFSAGKSTLTTNLHRDIWVARLDDKGQVVWAVALGNEQSNEAVGGMAIAPDGFVFLAGTFGPNTKLGHVQLTTKGQDDVFVVQLGPWGKVHWVGQAGGAGREQVGGVAVDSQGRVHVLGATESQTAELGSVTLQHPNSQRKPHAFVWSFWPYSPARP